MDIQISDFLPTTIDPMYTTWTTKDSVILSWINATLGENVLARVLGATTSREAWVRLEPLHAIHAKSQLMNLQHTLQNLQKNDLF